MLSNDGVSRRFGSFISIFFRFIGVALSILEGVVDGFS